MRTNAWSSRVGLPFALGSWLLGLCGRPGWAADGNDAPPDPASLVEQESRWTTTLRLQVPVSQIVIWKPTQDYDGWESVGGFSVSERFGRLFEAEVGATYASNTCSHGWQESVRSGLAPEVWRTRPQGAHWSVRVPALGAYSQTSLEGSNCDGLVRKVVHTLTIDTGLDVTYWTKGRWGFNTRLLAGVGHAWDKNADDTRSGLALEGALAFGVSF